MLAYASWFTTVLVESNYFIGSLSLCSILFSKSIWRENIVMKWVRVDAVQASYFLAGLTRTFFDQAFESWLKDAPLLADLDRK